MSAKNDKKVSQSDRSKINAIVTVLRGQYEDRLHVATQEFHQAQHEVNRASHEITRLEQHLKRVDDFCKNNNVQCKVK